MGANNKSRAEYLDSVLSDPSVLETTLKRDGVAGIRALLGNSYSKVLKSRGLWDYYLSIRSENPTRTYPSSKQNDYTLLLTTNLESVHHLYLSRGYSVLEELFNGHVTRAFARAGLSDVLEQWKKEPHYTKPNYGQDPEKAKKHAQLFLNPEKLEEMHQIYRTQGSDALSEYLGSDNIGNCFKTFHLYDVWLKWQSEPHRTYHSFSTSKTEQKLQDFLESKGIKVLRNQRFLPNGQEIDLYLPDYKVGIEINGVQFHLTGDSVDKLSHFTAFHAKTYHATKTANALAAGVRLFHYWSFQSLSIFESLLLSKLGMVQKVYARKLTSVQLSSLENAEFFNQNHLDGSTVSRGYGLVDDTGKIYCALALRRQPRIHVLEIARFANLKGFQVIGGFSKLFKHVVPDGVSVVSYCNRDISPDPSASIYSKLGFDFVGDTGPILRYWVYKSVGGLSPGVYDRRCFQKSRLRDQFSDYVDEPIDLFLRSKEIYPFHNSGNWKFVLNQTKEKQNGFNSYSVYENVQRQES